MANQDVVVHQGASAPAVQAHGSRDIIPAAEQIQTSLMEQVLIQGDLAKLPAADRLRYYRGLCQSLKLNPLTKPFEYLELDGKLTLYVKRDGTDQISANYKLQRKIIARELVDGVYVVTALAKMPDGREEESIGAVPLVKEGGEWKKAQSGKPYFSGNGVFKPLAPDARANAMMKAETKAKRRATLSLCGLGFILDESELDTVANARVVSVEDAHAIDVLPSSAPASQAASAPKASTERQPSTGQKGGTPSGDSQSNTGAASPRNEAAAPDDPPALRQAMEEFYAVRGYDRLGKFGDRKKDIEELVGDNTNYYRILGEFGVKKANQFKTEADANACYRALVIFLIKCSECQAEPPANVISDDDLPPELRGANSVEVANNA